MAGHAHGHGPEHAVEAYGGDIGEDYNIGTIVTVAVVGVLLLILVILWLRAMYARAERWEWERKVVAERFVELEQQHESQFMLLGSREWTDPARNKVSVPIEEVYGKVLNQLRLEQAAQQGAAAIAPAAAPLLESTEAAAQVSAAAPEESAPAAAGVHEADPSSTVAEAAQGEDEVAQH